jgi:hypothetical protein
MEEVVGEAVLLVGDPRIMVGIASTLEGLVELE